MKHRRSSEAAAQGDKRQNPATKRSAASPPAQAPPPEAKPRGANGDRLTLRLSRAPEPKAPASIPPLGEDSLRRLPGEPIPAWMGARSRLKAIRRGWLTNPRCARHGAEPDPSLGCGTPSCARSS